MKRRTKIISVFIFIGLIVAGGISSYVLRNRSIGKEALVSLGGQKVIYPDGLGVEIIIAGNDDDRTTVVVLLHCSTIDPSQNELAQGIVYSSDNPVGDMKSTYTVTTHYPPDPAISGLWVDGQKRAIGDGLTVVYISDKQAATPLEISAQQQEAFVNDAREMDPLEFVKKWVPSEVLAAN